ncbi:hypothetical protein [Arcanobacterium phocae]|uniref:hypothetical protein n=1 Tax=Arcanobacterium phocae TaxID=131112 RepID=UPI001C10D2DC|nr:hypothetical protein [Arcanobacterium phocae]
MKFNFKSRISGIVAFLLAFVMAGSTYLAVLQIDDEVNRELAVTASEAQIAAIVITGIVFVVVFFVGISCRCAYLGTQAATRSSW